VGLAAGAAAAVDGAWVVDVDLLPPQATRRPPTAETATPLPNVRINTRREMFERECCTNDCAIWLLDTETLLLKCRGTRYRYLNTRMGRWNVEDPLKVTRLNICDNPRHFLPNVSTARHTLGLPRFVLIVKLSKFDDSVDRAANMRLHHSACLIGIPISHLDEHPQMLFM